MNLTKLLIAATLMSATASSLSAASLTWDRLGASPAAPVGGAGTWDTTNARWSDGVADNVWNNANNDTAVLGGALGGGYTDVTLGAGITAGGISFNQTTGVYRLTGNTLTLAGTTPTISLGNVNSQIDSVIAGTNGLTTTGTGTTARLNLGGANTFTGGLTIGANSIVQVNAADVIADSNDVTVGGGFRLAANETIAGLNGDGKVGASNGVSATLTVGSGNADGTFSGNYGTAVASGDATGTLHLIKIGTGTQVLSGTNNFRSGPNETRGTVTVNGGTLQFGKVVSLYNTPGAWTVGNIIVNAGATAAFNVGGTGEFASTNIDALKVLGTGSGGFKNGSRIGLDTTNAAGGNFAYTNFANTNSGANSLGLDKLGTGTLTLSGVSTHTGGTAVKAGTLALASGGSIIVGAGDVTIASGATLALASGSTLHLASVNATIANAGTLSGAGDIDLGGFFNGWNTGASGSYTLIIGGDSTGGLFTVSNYDTGVWSSVVFNGVTGKLDFTAVPEPGTYGLLGAGALAGLAFVRRRRRLV